MYIVSVFLFVAAANLDSFVVGLSYGVRRVHIQFRANLLIAGIVMLGTFLTMVLGAVLAALEEKGYSFVSAKVEMVPQNYVKLTDEADIKNMEKLIDLLEENDDVQNVWHNWDQD